MRVTGNLCQTVSVALGNFQKSLKVFCRVRPTFDCQKIDNLNEELRPTFAGFAHYVDELFQSRQKSIVTDAQQRPARNVANAGCFDYQSRRPSFGKPPIPIKIVLCDKSIFRRAPGNHRRNPRSTLERQWTDLNWLEEKRL